MFTGIIEEIGTIQKLAKGPQSLRLTIGAHTVLEDTQVGDSIATGGVCLTVTDLTATTFSVDVMYETLNRSSLAALTVGSKVNLERALTLQKRLGGHLMSGHVDGLATLVSLKEEDIAWIYRFKIDPALTKYMVEKGSIGIDGISLTLIEVTADHFAVSIIPHTQANTTLATLKVGDKVNIEVDMMSKYVEKILGVSPTPGLSEERLKSYGY